MSEFDSLARALKSYFDCSIDDLPRELKERVRRQLPEELWTLTTPDERRIAASQWDFQNDPSFEDELQRDWDLYLNEEEAKQIAQELQELRAMPVGKFSDLDFKKRVELETRLEELEQSVSDTDVDSIAQIDDISLGERNKGLQQDANELAKKMKKESKQNRRITKREIVEKLASSEKWNHMNATTIERILLVEW